MKLPRVYVAGAISDSNVLQVFENIRRGIKTSAELFFSKKYAPFCPFLDYQFSFFKNGESVKVEDYHRYSLAWLEVSDCVLVLPDSERSVGTQGEIKRAEELGIPVFYSRQELEEWVKVGV